MNVDETVLSDPVAMRAFKVVLEGNQVSHRTLVERLKPAAAPPDLKVSLSKIVGSGLVKATEAPIEDFKTYYVTAEGLSKGRAWRQNLAALDR